MDPPVQFVVAILMPVAAVYGLIGSVRVVRWAGEWRDRLHMAEPEPIERLAADLRRLRAQLEDMETRADVPAKNLRLRALRGAYVDTLRTACQRLEVTPPRWTGTPGRQQADQAEIYRVESELRRRGLDVRVPASH